MSPFVAASAVALQENPAVNAVIDDGHIVYRDYVDISIAVSSPTGLVRARVGLGLGSPRLPVWSGLG